MATSRFSTSMSSTISTANPLGAVSIPGMVVRISTFPTRHGRRPCVSRWFYMIPKHDWKMGRLSSSLSDCQSDANLTIFKSIDRPGGRASAGMRRGNSIILVIGLIVLLLIIAISFITRAQGLRSTAAAYRDASVHDGSGDSIARHIAKNVADALFVENIDPLDETGQVVIGPVDEDVRIKQIVIPDMESIPISVGTTRHGPWSPDQSTRLADYPNKVGLQNEYYNAGSASRPWIPSYGTTRCSLALFSLRGRTPEVVQVSRTPDGFEISSPEAVHSARSGW